jgi:DNA-binding NarL/FixJ family response regulator
MAHRILVVDDSRSALKGIRAVIETQPEWEVCGEITNPYEGILKAKTMMPDVVIVDLHMQQIDGFEVARAIKNSRPEVPIILYSVFGTSGIVPSAITVGIRQVVSKADGGPALIHAIRQALQRSSAAAS